MYDTATGVAHDPQVALEWYYLAAEKGNARAQCNVGMMLQGGEGGAAQDLAAAQRWYV